MATNLDPKVRSVLERFFSLHHFSPFHRHLSEFGDEELLGEVLRILGGIDLDPRVVDKDLTDICDIFDVGIDVALKVYQLILDELILRVRAKLAEYTPQSVHQAPAELGTTEGS